MRPSSNNTFNKNNKRLNTVIKYVIRTVSKHSRLKVVKYIKKKKKSSQNTIKEALLLLIVFCCSLQPVNIYIRMYDKLAPF